jgi:hypothetical protein
MPTWLYVLLCLAVPSVWGVAMFYAFELVARRARRGGGPKGSAAAGDDKGPPPVDYSI